MAPKCRRPLIPLIASIGCLGTSLQAAEWSAQPSIQIREEYNDNIRLTRLPHDAVWKTSLEPSLQISRRSPLWDLVGTGRFRAQWYDGEDGRDTTDSSLNLTALRRFERGSLSGSAAVYNDTNYQNDDLDLDTGLIITQVDRTRKNYTLTGNYKLTETTSIVGTLAQQKTEYDNAASFGLLNYDSVNPSVELHHQFNRKTSAYSVLSYRQVDYEGARDLESKTISLQVGVDHNLSETWNINASVGSRKTETSDTVLVQVPRPGFELLFDDVYDTVRRPRESETTGLVYNASLKREFETGSITFTASQSVTPSSTGTDTESTSFGFIGSKNLSETLSTKLAIRYLESTTIGSTTTLADLERLRINPSVDWSIDRDLTLVAGYSYTRVERQLSNSDADSNAAYISLKYEWPRVVISR